MTFDPGGFLYKPRWCSLHGRVFCLNCGNFQLLALQMPNSTVDNCSALYFLPKKNAMSREEMLYLPFSIIA